MAQPRWLSPIPWGPPHLSDPVLAGAPPRAILATVVGSAGIFEACREAADLSWLSGGRSVAFSFNDRLVVVGSGDDPNAIARSWWIAQNGKTPEQSLVLRKESSTGARNIASDAEFAKWCEALKPCKSCSRKFWGPACPCEQQRARNHGAGR